MFTVIKGVVVTSRIAAFRMSCGQSIYNIDWNNSIELSSLIFYNTRKFFFQAPRMQFDVFWMIFLFLRGYSSQKKNSEILYVVV